MKKPFFILFLFLSLNSFSQPGVAINNSGSAPAGSAMLDVQSTSKGMLIPRMNSGQRTTISSPANGLLVFDTTTESFWFYSGAWTELLDKNNSGWVKKNDTVSATAPLVGIGTNNPSRMLTLKFNNANLNTSHFLIEQAGTGDSWFNIGLSGSAHYALGIDNSDSDKFKIGFNATSPSALHTNTFLTIDNEGDIGIGVTSMTDRLHVNSITGQNPFRADVNGITRFQVFSNGGASIGSSAVPSVNGLRVAGPINPVGGISSSGNIIMTSTAGYVSITAGGSEIRIFANGQININSAGDLNINAAGELSLSGSSVSLVSTSTLDIESGTHMVIDADASMNVFSATGMSIQNSSGTMNVQNTTGTMQVRSLGGVLNVNSSSTLNLDGAIVDINNGSNGATRVLDAVSGGLIITGSSSVKIGN
jgi:hypothetical protein